MATANVSHTQSVYFALRDWLDRSRVDRLFYDHLPFSIEAGQPEIVRAFRDFKREGLIAKFVTCEDGIVFLRSTAQSEVTQ